MKTFLNNKNKSLKAAVIGVGNMGKHRARLYATLEGVDLVAVSDVNENRAKEISKEFGCRCYKDYNQMLNKERIDIVSVSAPTKLHKKIALDAIKHKKDLMIEKPMASSKHEAEEIIKAAKKNRIKLTVSHAERFNPAIEKLKELIKQKQFGKITSIIVRRVGIFPPHPLPEPNVITGLVIHDLDILDYLLDGQQPLEVFANGENFLTKQGEDSAEVFLSYKKMSGFIQVNWITPGKIRTISITGLKGYAELNCLSQELEIRRVKKQEKTSNFKKNMEFSQPAKEKIKIDVKEPLFCEVESFVKCVRDNKKLSVTGENGLNALIIVGKILKSLKNNKIVKL